MRKKLMSSKERLDTLLVKKGIFESREKAKVYIMAGKIYVNGVKADKVGNKYDEDSEIEFRGDKMKYVSRGGYKLEKAVNHFNLDLTDKICYDIGASTGGFTDCMLQNGASLVYAIDVGYGQFAWKLRCDSRVVPIERTNVRYMEFTDQFQKGDFASIDVSFISIKKIIPNLLNFLKDQGEIAALIKPQFEAGRDKVGKKGVVRDKSVHREVVQNIVDFVSGLNLEIKGLTYSPIKGPEGNIEYLIYLKKGSNPSTLEPEIIDEVIEESHRNLSLEE
jgi:23S rRNA (cytidine1920-2'-O)/16S rRNA (cytidine1409-2'-O)-methyltransferase